MEKQKIEHSGFKPVEKNVIKKKYDFFTILNTIKNLTAYQKTFLQMGACGLILLTVLVLKVADTPFSNNAIEGMNLVVKGEVEIDEDLGRLKLVSKEVKSVFNEGITMPIETLSENIGFTENTMMILGKLNEPVFATFSGVVESKTENEIVIAHESGVKSVYTGLLPTAFVEDSVLSGQAVGYLQDEYLKVNIIYNEEYLKPDEFLKDSILR